MVLPAEVKRKVTHVENIATLPSIAIEILEIIRNDQAGMKEIAKVIEKDPSVTTKILKVSNSPLWGFPGRVDSVHRSIVLLGLKQVLNIVIAVSLYSTFTKLKPNPYFDREKFWLHSSGTGQIARTLSKKLNLSFQGEEFVAALIHDLGKLVFDQFLNTQFQQILQYARESGKQVFIVEKEVLGCNHADVAGWLLKKWHFPESIVAAVTYHHNPQDAGNYKVLASVIHIADMLCEMWGVGFDEDLKKFCLYDDPAWRILKQFNPNLYKLDVEKFTFELIHEIEKAQLFIKLIKD